MHEINIAVLSHILQAICYIGEEWEFPLHVRNYTDPTFFGNRTGSGIRILNSHKNQGKPRNTLIFITLGKLPMAEKHLFPVTNFV